MATKRGASGEIKVRVPGREHSVRVRLAPDRDHKSWHWSPWRKVKGNMNQARAELVAYEQELKDDAAGLNITVGAYADEWQAKREELGKVAPLTIQRDAKEIERIKKYLGAEKLRYLTAERIEKAYAEAKKEESLTPSGIHKFHAKLSQILKKAYVDRRIDRNPCDAIDGIKRPKVGPDKKERKRITEQEAIRFQKELREEPKSSKTMAVWLMLATGMRRGEALALTWDNIDLENSRLTIANQYGKEHEPKQPKTEKSRRTIALDPITVDMLKDWKNQQRTLFEAKEWKHTGKTPVCSSRSGGYLEPDTFNRWRRDFYVEHGLGYYEDPEKKTGYVGPDSHSLRHAQATMLVAEGVNPKTVQERLGHARISTTLEIYAEAEEEKDAEAAAKIGALFGE